MASVTLAEAAKLTQNHLVAGIIESIVSVNPMYQFLPFDSFSGNALAYNVENALGGSAFIGKGANNTIPAAAKTAATFTQKTATLVPLIGDAEVDHFVQATMSNVNDQKAIQVQSKAKSIGRQFQDSMINGDTTVDTLSFDGLMKIVPSGRQIATGTSGDDLSFELLDELISMVLAKDGQVDYFMMSDAHIRKYFTLLRALGGAYIGEVITLPNGQTVPTYRNVPLFRNDYIKVHDADPDEGTTVNCSPIFAGTFDDGSRKVGLAGLTSEVNSGVFVTEVGEEEDNNNTITRVRFYCGLALFNELGIAMAKNVKV